MRVAESRWMKTPARLRPLMDAGLIDGAVRQLNRAREADVFVVRCEDKVCAANAY